jgi:hypothetical protein
MNGGVKLFATGKNNDLSLGMGEKGREERIL